MKYSEEKEERYDKYGSGGGHDYKDDKYGGHDGDDYDDKEKMMMMKDKKY
jgi:hypothetical protein